MTDTPEKLTAEEEALLRSEMAKVQASGREYGLPASVVARIVATLDASRAETEAVRRERGALAEFRDLAREACDRADRVEALAAELVEGLEEARDEIAELSNMLSREPDIARIVSLIGQARAQGIGGEKESAHTPEGFDQAKPHKGRIEAWFRLPCTEGAGFYVMGRFLEHPAFGAKFTNSSPVYKHDATSGEIETRNSRYTLVGNAVPEYWP
ncbi:MAG: hypothetical protein WC869_11790 [Phycisphaerae bacterium]|jgi:hypothetical protein